MSRLPASYQSDVIDPVAAIGGSRTPHRNLNLGISFRWSQFSCSDNLVGSRRWPSPEVGEGNAATRFHQSAWLPPVHKETAGPCVRIVEDGEVSRWRYPFRGPAINA